MKYAIIAVIALAVLWSIAEDIAQHVHGKSLRQYLKEEKQKEEYEE